MITYNFKKISNLLVSKGVILSDLEFVLSKQKLEIYYGIDLKFYRKLIFLVDKKTKIYNTEALKFMQISNEIQDIKQKIIKHKILFHNCGIGKTSKDTLKNDGWKIYEFS